MDKERAFKITIYFYKGAIVSTEIKSGTEEEMYKEFRRLQLAWSRSRGYFQWFYSSFTSIQGKDRFSCLLLENVSRIEIEKIK